MCEVRSDEGKTDLSGVVMVKMTKGVRTRLEIVAGARQVFNVKGIHITLSELAAELGFGLSHITNHYRTKDHLFVAIAQEYDQRYNALVEAFRQEPGTSLSRIAKFFSAVMDEQYEYRCSLITIFSVSNSEKLLFRQITESYPKKKTDIRRFVKDMVTEGILDESILSRKHYDVFNFEFINLFQTWMVNLELYDPEKGYRKMKPIYLAGILNCFQPFLSKKAKAEFDALDIKKFC